MLPACNLFHSSSIFGRAPASQIAPLKYAHPRETASVQESYGIARRVVNLHRKIRILSDGFIEGLLLFFYISIFFKNRLVRFGGYFDLI